MIYKLLAVSKNSNIGVNIGDYIQALASSQFYPSIDGFLDRDKDLKGYDGEPCKMIMNGWYMHEPSNWPPSERIIPLFVAFHLNSTAKDQMLTEEGISYLKRHEPIGCRDTHTQQILNSHGIDAYFSGCMTLTLGKKFHSDEKDDCIYIVDPPINSRLDIRHTLLALTEILTQPTDIYKLYRTKHLNLHHGRNWIKKALKTALYYREYCKMFGRNTVMGATYICQEDTYYKNRLGTDEERLKEAERLVRLYAKAKMVITSRIHCALPCLGLETPVIYIEKAQDVEESSCRMGGLIDLFNVVKIGNGVLKPTFEVKTPITADNIPKNKGAWKKLSESLCSRCESFINQS